MRHWLFRVISLMGWVLAAVALTATTLAVAENAPKDTGKKAPRAPLAIIFSNDTEGYLEPCG